MNLENKSALVTGGTKGIGAGTAIALAQAGANVAIAARHVDEEARAVKARIESLRRTCVMIEADFAKPTDATAAVERTARELGGVDVLVHSAGGLVAGGLLDLTPEAWHAGFDVHVHAVFHLCRAAIPLMKQKKEGAIVLISSVAGVRGIKSNIGYQAVKGILPQMARALAWEFADFNIRTNCVAPGIIRTAFHAKMTPEAQKHNLDNRVPLHREGTPEQVASLIRELVCNDYITGETMVIDGGLTMRIC